MYVKKKNRKRLKIAVYKEMWVASFRNELKQNNNSRNELLSELIRFIRRHVSVNLSLINKKKQNLPSSSGCL